MQTDHETGRHPLPSTGSRPKLHSIFDILRVKDPGPTRSRHIEDKLGGTKRSLSLCDRGRYVQFKRSQPKWHGNRRDIAALAREIVD